MKKILETILDHNDRDFPDIYEYWGVYPFESEEECQRVLDVIVRMDKRGEECIKVELLQAPEFMILDAVWQRANSPDNAPNRDNIRAMIMTQLADCYERCDNKYYMVCATSRVARVLSALTILDADPNISQTAIDVLLH